MKNTILRAGFVVLFIIPLFLISCKKSSDSLPDKPVNINLTLKQASLIESENGFAFDIFKEVLKSANETDNIIISPLSISYALSMTVNGANAATRDSMLKALRVNDITMDELNKSYKDLTEALLSVDARVLISIANSVWTESTFIAKKTFADILTDFYNAEAKSFDINDPTAPAQMNKWIEDHTNGLIKNMIDQLDPYTKMLLINAIYFKGKWQVQFDTKGTNARSFTRADGSNVEVPTMSQEATHKVYKGNGFIIAEVPYGQGNFVMDIILPDNNDVSTVSPLLTDTNFNTWVNALYAAKVDLYLPKFKYGFKEKLKPALSVMGMGLAFSDFADFTNIADYPPLQIKDVIHQAFIETNEEGTEAAAATVVEIRATSMGPDTPLLIDVNHPFIYFIRETTTNTILFMGRVVDPATN
jgi:serine protease inhibitor